MKAGITEKASEMIINSIRSSTQKQYTVYIKKFLDYCFKQCICLSSVKEIHIINFLQYLFDSGSGYSVINTACSAACYVLTLIGFPIMSSAMLTKYKKGVFNCRPSLPRHVSTWDPQIVLDYFSIKDCDDIPFLAKKSVILLALASCMRVSTIQSLKCSDILFSDKKLTIQISELQKQSRPGFHQSAIELKRFDNKSQCVVSALEVYLTSAGAYRKMSNATNLYITTTKPYGNASKDTLARWIKAGIHEAGIPNNFTAHSTRSASTSNLARSGIDVHTILSKAGWSTASTFHKFYNKPL